MSVSSGCEEKTGVETVVKTQEAEVKKLKSPWMPAAWKRQSSWGNYSASGRNSFNAQTILRDAIEVNSAWKTRSARPRA